MNNLGFLLLRKVQYRHVTTFPPNSYVALLFTALLKMELILLLHPIPSHKSDSFTRTLRYSNVWQCLEEREPLQRDTNEIYIYIYPRFHENDRVRNVTWKTAEV